MSADSVLYSVGVASPIGDPRDYSSPSSQWYQPTDLEEVKKRLDLLESNLKALPAVIAESIIIAFSGMTFTGNPNLSSVDVYSPLAPRQATTVWQGGVQDGNTIGLKVDLGPFLLALESRVQCCLHDTVDFSELDKLRARIRELEEDLGYRVAVANKLREEPAGK
jgi:hypothetical protein